MWQLYTWDCHCWSLLLDEKRRSTRKLTAQLFVSKISLLLRDQGLTGLKRKIGSQAWDTSDSQAGLGYQWFAARLGVEVIRRLWVLEGCRLGVPVIHRLWVLKGCRLGVNDLQACVSSMHRLWGLNNSQNPSRVFKKSACSNEPNFIMQPTFET